MVNYRVLAPEAVFKSKYDNSASLGDHQEKETGDSFCQNKLLSCIVCFRGNEGHTPLVKASLKGHHNVVKLLLKRGAKVEPQDLRAAIEEGNE